MKKEVSSKNVCCIFILFIFLGSLFSFFIYNEYYSIKRINEDGLNNKDVLFTVESIENNSSSRMVSVRGWAAKKNENLNTVNTYIALRNDKTSEVYKINTVKEQRKDVTLFFNNLYNYDNSGFFTRFNKDALKNKGKYEICILYLSDNNTDYVPTGKFLDIN